VNVDKQCVVIVNTSVDDGLASAYHASIAVIRRAIQLEGKARVPRTSLIRGLKAELRRKEREAAAEPKERA